MSSIDLASFEAVDLSRCGKGGRSRSFDHDKAAKLKKQGLTLQQIATRFGVTKSAVSRALSQSLTGGEG